MTAVERFLDTLEAHGQTARRTGNGATCQCPAHDDRQASLSVSEGEDGRVLLHCFAGCTAEAVAGAVGLELADLYEPHDPVRSGRRDGEPPDRHRRRLRPASQRAADALPGEGQVSEWAERLQRFERVLARLRELRGWTPAALDALGVGFDDERLTLPVRGPTGELTNLLRYRPGANGEGPKMLALRGRPRGLFPAPESLPAGTVWLVEGEPDAVSLASVDIPSVAVPGAHGWRAEHAQRFAGREVVVCCDCDAPGRKLAAVCARDLIGHAQSVRVLDLSASRSDGYDVGAFLADARDPEDRHQAAGLLRRTAEAVPEVAVPSATLLNPPGTVAPSTDSPGSTGNSAVPSLGTRGTAGARADTLRVLDVARMLREPPPPVPWLAEPVLVRGCVTMLAGREGAGKSMLALGLAASMGNGDSAAGMKCAPGRTLYVDAENGEREAHRRIHGLGVRPDTLVYVEADGFSLRDRFDELTRLLPEHEPRLIVLDSLRSLAPGLDENDSAQAEAWLRPLVTLAQTSDIAVLLLHHAGKTGAEYRGSTGLGAAVQLGFALGRAPDDPEQTTRRSLTCWKCRPAPEPPKRWLALGVNASGRIVLDAAEPFEPAAVRRDEDADELLAALGGEAMTWTEWAQAAGLNPKGGTARRARDVLCERGSVDRGEDRRYRRTLREAA